MAKQISIARHNDAVIQFSVFTKNRLGKLHELMGVLGAHDVHIVGLTVLDTTDSAIMRIVVDNPDKTRELLVKNDFPFNESSLVVVEFDSTAEMEKLMNALLEAELNVNYLYSFIPHPQGKSIIGLSMEHGETAEEALRKRQFRVLKQSDISR